MNIKKYIRHIPDFPKKGIIFADITPILASPWLASRVYGQLCGGFGRVDKVIGIDARGFIFGIGVANRLQKPFVPVRKAGKLPHKTISQSYKKEYGTDTLEIHADAIEKGDRVLVVDDLLATGGTAAAVAKLVKNAGGKLVGISFVVELGYLSGRKKLKGIKVKSLVNYKDVKEQELYNTVL